VRRLLATPVGWFGFLAVEMAVLILLWRLLGRLFPGMSLRADAVVLLLMGLGFTIANYAVRRRYLPPH
jgi:hypothetical protein